MAETESSGGEELSSANGDRVPPPAEDLQKTTVTVTLLSSADSAIRSLRLNSSANIRSLQEFVGDAKSQLKSYEDKLLDSVKEELKVCKEHPFATAGIGVAAAFLLAPRPRSFLFRHTLARFQSQEAQFVRVENNVKELGLSVDLMKNESRKLLERAALAERDMKYGHSELLKAGNQIQHLAKSVYKVEAQAADVMDALRETPGREALKLRAEVASVLTHLKSHKVELDEHIMKISDLGVPV